MTYSYQWLRCPATGTACVAVHGSTTANYKLGTADVGKRIRLVVTAGNGAGSTAASSAITAIVKATAPAAVRAVNGNAKANRLTGTARAERIDGKGGNDRIDGRGGKDTLIGGTGNDTIMAADGIAETVSCGPGRDTAVVDRSDKVSGCEKVTRRAPKKATVKKKK
jgi:Ca2+-binding RTX toxin-like protein